MKVLLINPPGWQSGSVSLGLGYLSSILLGDGHEVMVLDQTGQALAPDSVAERARSFAPDVVGLHCKTAQANAAATISRAIKDAAPNSVHVVGGPHVTLCHEEFMRENSQFDYGVLGEADLNVSELCRRIREEKPVADIPGVAWRDGDEIVVTERQMVLDLDELPRPNFDVIEGFSWNGFRYPLLTSRGCPYKCNFCSVPLISSRRFRQRSPADCIDELATVKQEKGITCFEILDDNLTLNMRRAKEFCQKLIEAKLDLSWYCHNGIRADRLDQELADLMKDAGCTSIAFGIESGDQEVFRRVDKGEELEHIVEAIEMTKRAGMQAVGYFIIGLPGDTLTAVKKTISFQRSLDLDHHVYGIFIPYPGTSGRDEVIHEGRIIRDIKETSHFSDRPQIAIEYPYFTRDEIEEAYCLATAGELCEFVEKWGFRDGMQNVLYVETHPPTHGYRRYRHWIRGGVDLLALSAYDGCFEQDQADGSARRIFYFESLPSRIPMGIQLVRLFLRLGRERYSLALFPFVRRRGFELAFLAFLVLVRPRHTVLYDFASQRFVQISLRDAKFRQKALDHLLRRVLGDVPDGAPLPKALLLLPWRLLRMSKRAVLHAAGELGARAAYSVLSVHLLLRRGPAR